MAHFGAPLFYQLIEEKDFGAIQEGIQSYRLPIFLLMIAAAWHAWRRNPVYFAKATGQFLGALVFLTAAVIGVNLWIFKRVPNSPGLVLRRWLQTVASFRKLPGRSPA